MGHDGSGARESAISSKRGIAALVTPHQAKKASGASYWKPRPYAGSPSLPEVNKSRR